MNYPWGNTFFDSAAPLFTSCVSSTIIRQSLTYETYVILVHAFVNSRLDYCNSLLFCASSHLISRLQSVMPASARLIFQKRKFDHISDGIREKLHWLSVQPRIIYKLCLLVRKCMQSEALLSSACKVRLFTICLRCFGLLVKIPILAALGDLHRSAAHGDLLIPRMRTKTLGPCSFAISAPTVWNSLPSELRNNSVDLQTFKSKVKSHLFKQAYFPHI